MDSNVFKSLRVAVAGALASVIQPSLAARSRQGGRPRLARFIGGWKHSHSAVGANGSRECERRRRQIANAQLRVHRGPAHCLHYWLPGSEAPTVTITGRCLKAWFAKAKMVRLVADAPMHADGGSAI